MNQRHSGVCALSRLSEQLPDGRRLQRLRQLVLTKLARKLYQAELPPVSDQENRGVNRYINFDLLGFLVDRAGFEPAASAFFGLAREGGVHTKLNYRPMVVLDCWLIYRFLRWMSLFY